MSDNERTALRNATSDIGLESGEQKIARLERELANARTVARDLSQATAIRYCEYESELTDLRGGLAVAMQTVRKKLDGALAAFEGQVQNTNSVEQQLGDLLAIIHRDGGQYQSAHGTDKAVADAHMIRAKLQRERDKAVRRRDEIAQGLERETVEKALAEAVRREQSRIILLTRRMYCGTRDLGDGNKLHQYNNDIEEAIQTLSQGGE